MVATVGKLAAGSDPQAGNDPAPLTIEGYQASSGGMNPDLPLADRLKSATGASRNG